MIDSVMNNKFARLVIILAVFVFVYFMFVRLSRVGETKVSVQVIPNDSIVLMNGQRIKPGVVYLKPGNYRFEAERSGFTKDQLDVTVSGQATDVALIPAPNSPEANAFLERNPALQAARESIGGARANANGLKIENKTPLVRLLPYSDINGPFTIDYGPSPVRKNDIFLLVSDSSPRGRENALRWIKQQGYDPTDLEIRFSDFNNPVVFAETAS